MVFVLAMGIGVNAALFTVARSLTTQPPPAIPRNDALVRIRGITTDEVSGMTFGRPLSRRELGDYENAGGVFRQVAAWTSDEATLDVAGASEPVLATASFVTGDIFGVLGVRPTVGGTLPATAVEGEGTSALVAVIDHGLWLNGFGGASDVVGKTLRVNGVVVTVVGVAPARFKGANQVETDHVVWLPLSARAQVAGPGAAVLPDSIPLQAVGLLRPGVSAADASSLVRSVATRDLPPTDAASRFTDVSTDVVPVRALNENPSLGTDASVFAVYATITLLILLVTGTTVSALFVGVGVTRRKEIVVRLALGAGRLRIVRTLLAESVTIAVAGGALGTFALWVFLHALSPHLPGVALVIDPTVLGGTLLFAMVTGVACGLSPALHATRLSVSEALKRSGSGAPASRLGLQRRLVIGQIALSQPLLVAVGALLVLLARDARVGSRSPVADRIAVVDFGRANGMPTSLPRSQARQTLEQLADELRSMPGVAQVAAGSGGFVVSDLTEEPERVGADAAPASVRIHGYYAAPGYLDLLRIPLVRGRGFQPDEVNAVVIGSDLARKLWGDSDPLGRKLRRSWRGQSGDEDMVVVGVYDAAVAGPSAEGGLGGGMRVYVPTAFSDGVEGAFRMYANGASALRILVRTDGPAKPVVPILGERIRARAPTLSVRSVATLAQLDERRHSASVRMIALAGAGGMMALLLASIGLYAVISLGVGERLREIGIRMAVGARADQVVSLFFRGGLRLSGIGLLFGLPLSVLVLRRVGGPLALSATVVTVAGGIVAAVLAVASLASWVPARRAAGVDPAVTLQEE